MIKRLLITGATGQFGQAAINSMLKKNYPANAIAALVRDENKAADLKAKGIDIRIGDYNDVASLTKAFRGIDSVLFVSASDVAQRTQQHENVIKALNASAVKQVVYTSFTRDEKAGPSAIDFVTDAHIKTEQWLKDSGKTYTFLRNNLYMDFVPVFIGEKVLETGVYFPAGSGKSAAATREEMAEAAANVLLSDEHANKVYNISNTEAWSFGEVAETLSSITGKQVNYYSPSQQEYKETLSNAGVPAEYVGMFAAFGEAVKQNEFNKTSNGLELLLGRKPTSLKTYFQLVYGKK
jgi:NAD(P)H dehydrogenase (quinone)